MAGKRNPPKILVRNGLKILRTRTGRHLCSSVLLLLQSCLLAWSASVWWASRNNTLFGNGRWISGKDTGKFVFFTYEFLSAPLLHSRVNLSDDMGFQEILYRQPEGPDRRLTRLRAEVYIANGGYLWIELRKQKLRLLGCRLSRLAGHPGGFFLYNEDGEVTERTPFADGRSKIGEDWQRLDLQLADGKWVLKRNGVEMGAVPDPEFSDGHCGFKGSGNVRASVFVKNIVMTFEDPRVPGRTWEVEEKFSARWHTRRVFKYGLLFSLTVLGLRRGRGVVLAHFLREDRRERFLRLDDGGLVLLLLVLATVSARASGLPIAAWVLVSECMTLILLGTFRRASAAAAFDPPAAGVWLYGAPVVLISSAAFVFCGGSLGRIRSIVPARMVGVHPDAFLVHPAQKRSAEPFVIGSPVRVGLGTPVFTEGLAYREQLISARFVMPGNSTLDIAFQQQSLLTRRDPGGEGIPLQRRVLRLTTRDDAPMGLAMGDRSRLAPFRRINGEVRAGLGNRVEIRTDDRGVLVSLNGEETWVRGYQPLGFGETGFLAYDAPVLLESVRVEATVAQSVREDVRPWLGASLSVLPAILLWLAARRGGLSFRNAAAAEWAALYALAVYFVAALFLGAETLDFLGRDRLAWLDVLLIATALTHLAVILKFRRSLCGAVVLFNAGLVLLFGFGFLLLWDRLPDEHSLRLKLTDETVAPGEVLTWRRGHEGPWYSNNRRIGSNTFVWKHRFGGEMCSTPKAEGMVRIFVVGGSQAWGSGAASSKETFAELIEKSLRAKGLPVEVFNAGVNGAGLSGVADCYRQLVRCFEPDILVADIGLNDSAALTLVRDATKRAGRVDVLIDTFRALAGLCREDGVDLVLALEAMAGELPLRPNRDLYAALAEIAGEIGAPAVDVAEMVREKEKDHFVWWDTAHYAPYGHELLAGLLAPVVEQTVRTRLQGPGPGL